MMSMPGEDFLSRRWGQGVDVVLVICLSLASGFLVFGYPREGGSVLFLLVFAGSMVSLAARAHAPRASMKLCSVIVFLTLLRLTYVSAPADGMFGRDLHYDLQATNLIILYGWGSEIYGYSNSLIAVAQWPVLHTIGATTQSVTGVELFTLGKLLPIFFGGISTISMYLFLRRMTGSEAVSLNSTLLGSLTLGNIFFDSLYVRQSIAFVFAMTLLWVVLGIRNTRGRWTSVGLLLVMTLALTHPLTTIFVVIFLVLAVTFDIAPRASSARSNHRKPIVTLIVLLTVFGLFIAYLARGFFDELVLSLSTLFVRSSDFGSTGGGLNRSLLRSHVIQAGFIGWFGVLSISSILRRRLMDQCFSPFMASAAIVGLGLMSAPYLTAILPKVFGIPRPDAFAMPFVAAFLFSSFQSRRGRWVILASFVLYAFVVISQIPSYVIEQNHDYDEGQSPMVYLGSDYAASAWLNSSPGEIAASEAGSEILSGWGGHSARYDESIWFGVWAPEWSWLYVRQDDYRLTRSLSIAESTSIGFSIKVEANYESDVSILRVFDAGSSKFFLSPRNMLGR